MYIYISVSRYLGAVENLPPQLFLAPHWSIVQLLVLFSFSALLCCTRFFRGRWRQTRTGRFFRSPNLANTVAEVGKKCFYKRGLRSSAVINRNADHGSELLQIGSSPSARCTVISPRPINILQPSCDRRGGASAQRRLTERVIVYIYSSHPPCFSCVCE